MGSLNKVQLIGRLGKNPELRNLDSGNQVANFTLATSESYKNKKGEKVEETTWHNIVLFGVKAELAEKYLSKGDQAYIEGKLSVRSYEKDGEKRYVTEVKGDEIVFLGKSGNSESREASKPTDNGGDLPF